MCALCEEGAAGGVQQDAFFQLKMNSAGFPKAEIYNELKNSPGGTSIVLKATDPQTNTKLIAIGYKYNSKKVLYFVGNDGAGSTVAGDAYQMRFADLHGNVSYRSVPRPAVISDFFSSRIVLMYTISFASMHFIWKRSGLQPSLISGFTQHW